MFSLANLNPQNLYARALMIVFSLGVTIGSGIGYGVSKAIPNTQPQELSKQTQLSDINSTNYERLQPGMSLTNVQAILGSGGIEIDRTLTTATIVWENPNGYRITAIFENDKLKNKKQPFKANSISNQNLRS